MQRIDGRPVYSATDLVGFLACRTLTELERAALEGLITRPVRDDPALDRIRKRGEEHEARFLASLEADGRRITTLKMPDDAWGLTRGEAIRAAADLTRAAILRGDDVIYQACFFDGTWVGYADFLLRVEQPTAVLPWRYEVVDTKLARTAKASALLQICSYVEQLERIQGAPPELVRVALGGSKREVRAYRTDDLMAYYRRAKKEFLAAAAIEPDPSRADLYPDPVEHCQVCRWAAECSGRRRKDDDLSLVAGIPRRTRRELKEDRDVRTRRGLAGLPLPLATPLERTSPDAFRRVRDQAAIQVRGEDQGRPLHELLLPPARTESGALDTSKGLPALPEPRPGDLFLDLEGDPFAFDDGIDYLFGVLELVPDGEPVFHAFWSRDEAGRVTLDAEKQAFERTVDLIMDRLARDPSIHVYHYATYERTAFGRLMGRHATRETQVDHLFRSGALVDLYRVVQQSLIASVESYSIKKLEPHYGYVRQRDLRDANSAIVAFEAWLEDGGEDGRGDEALKDIEEYNEDDVRSTWWLRQWLEGLRRELAGHVAEPLPRPPAWEDPAASGVDAQRSEADALAARLTEGLPAEAIDRTSDQQARWLLAQLLGWHRRENKAGWWRYFSLRDHYTDEQRVAEKEPIGMLELIGEVAGKERTFQYRYPAQEHGVREGRPALDPDPDVRRSLAVLDVDDDALIIELRHPVPKHGDATIHHPRSLIPDVVVNTGTMEKSLLRIGRAALDLPSLDADGPYPAARALLRSAAPRAGQEPGQPLLAAGETSVGGGRRLVVALRDSYLPIQGPPGSGKTYTGARMVLDLVEQGRRVAVTANSHKVIGKLLDSIAAAATEERRAVRLGQKGADGEPITCKRATPLKDGKAIRVAFARPKDDPEGVDVVGATAWTWSHEDMEGSVDVVVVDEGGQFSLANAIAVSPAGHSLVLLGDPQQLDQPVQGTHPPGAERSALAHLLQDAKTMQPSQGLFLDRTWRLHPDIARVTSELFYERRLEPEAGNERQGLRGVGALDGTGIRWVPVPHAGNDTSSPEEVAVVVDMVAMLLESRRAAWIDRRGHPRPIGPEDVLIVTPWNTQRVALEKALVARLGPEVGGKVPVGTVDKFQGQEAPISIYAMGTSSVDEAPRGMEFLYSLNRLNVATSRAQCLTVVVASPELIRAPVVTPEQVRLANALCRIVEVAEATAGRARTA